MPQQTAIEIDRALRDRLADLAAREGLTAAELTDRILRAHADRAEKALDEAQQDEARWQAYRATGVALPLQTVRDKLHRLAAEAAARVEKE